MKEKRTRAYKAFDKNLQCRGVQYEVGYIFTEDSLEIIPCRSGIHCCLQLKDVFNYYDANEDTRVCEIEVIGDYVEETDKIACREIEILRELSLDEIKKLTDDYRFNSGYRNSGNRNSGDYNSGDYNSGHYNSGHYNSGDYNSGYRNSGNRNSGNRNSGHYNSGHLNSGHYNSGHYNSGNLNSGDYNSGYFNSNEPTVRMFNKDTGLLKIEIKQLDEVNQIIFKYWKQHLTWVWGSNMTDKEKEDNPSYKTTGGFLKQSEYNYKKSWKRVWGKCSKEEKQVFLDLPNFDVKVFEEITGIKIKTNIFRKPVLD